MDGKVNRVDAPNKGHSVAYAKKVYERLDNAATAARVVNKRFVKQAIRRELRKMAKEISEKESYKDIL